MTVKGKTGRILHILTLLRNNVADIARFFFFFRSLEGNRVFFSLRNTVEPFIVDLSLLRAVLLVPECSTSHFWLYNTESYAMRTPGSVAFIKIKLKSAHRGHRTISFSQILQDPISSHIGWF